ncbi:type II toxin-antitoxin system RelE/ParE family toxin [Sulfurimonas sp. CS5]|uniref:type II toxin-antitoxin system RelE/ParE family toxin n=1 Tax=Sulfurimonas sp. CS5 TaxID=3391145 RepID=UPI0039E9A13E
MQIVYEESFSKSFLNILTFISKDKKSSAIKFKNNLKEKIELLKLSPLMCRKSKYIDNENYRDLIFKGYTTIYKIEEKQIKILDIFKWEDRAQT